MNEENTLLNKLYPDNQVLKACTDIEQISYIRLWEKKQSGLNFYQDPDEITEEGLWDVEWLQKKYPHRFYK